MPTAGPTDLAALPRKELRAHMKSLGVPAYRGDQVFRWIWGRGARTFEEMTDLPAALRARLTEECVLALPTVARATVGEDGTRKLLVRLHDGLHVESVVIPDGARVTLCISSQVGCALACAFCATGTMGLTRHLSAGEIAGQVSLANELLRTDPVEDRRDDGEPHEDDAAEPPANPDRPVTNIVYMGMGEPLHNDTGTFDSLAILTDDTGMHYAARRITVSTVGLVPRMLELGEKYPVVLAVSLHAADDELRGRIMPVNKRYDLAAVLDACRAFPRKSRERITFEYVLLAGVNDRKEDAERLVALLGDLRCKVNLIPFNEHEGAPFTRPDERHVERFDRSLRDGGLPTFVRRTRGRDIAAACGQLAVGERKRTEAVADQAGASG